MTQIDRAVRSVDNAPEVFTPEDYREAICLDFYLEDLAIEIGIPVDSHKPKPEVREQFGIDMISLPEKPEVIESLKEMLFGIEESCEEVSQNVVSPVKDEARSFVGTEAREIYNLKPFNQQIRYFASRFIVEFLESRNQSYEELQESDWLDAIKQAKKLIRGIPGQVDSVYSVDIPAYTVLYREFDELRRDSTYPLEVYLGRDGIYAYYGRLAQNAARGDNDPVTDSFPLDDAQLVLRPDPKYIVYSRDIMWHANRADKERYLKQFIDADDDLHFYDTGYQGSIPEDIMTILGFKKREIDERIHLLNTPNRARRLAGVPKNVDIAIIEGNPKPEESARGLRGDGEDVVYRTEPAPIGEQFKFQVIRDVLLRHFWIREYSEITSHLARTIVR